MEDHVLADTILVVEDDESIADMLELAIGELTGWRTMVAGNGEAALELVRREKPAGVLLDIMLPGMSGLNVFDELKCHADTAGIPVLFMSCVDRFWPELRKRGVRRFLTKPFSLDTLALYLNEMLREPKPLAA